MSRKQHGFVVFFYRDPAGGRFVELPTVFGLHCETSSAFWPSSLVSAPNQHQSFVQLQETASMEEIINIFTQSKETDETGITELNFLSAYLDGSMHDSFITEERINLFHSAATQKVSTLIEAEMYVHSQKQTQNEEFSERPGQQVCEYFMKNGDCEHRSACKYHHPMNRASSLSDLKIVDHSANDHHLKGKALSNFLAEDLTSHNQKYTHFDGFPERPDQPECAYFMKNGDCKYRSTCKYHHPKSRGQSLSHGLREKGLPLRPVNIAQVHRHAKHNVARLVRWIPPDANFVKVNVDGGYKKKLGLASIGGIVRGSKGEWHFGFSGFAGFAPSPLLPELMAIRTGLSLVWEKGYRQVICESDCLDAIRLCLGESNNNNNQFGNVVADIHLLLRKEWEVRLVHTFREVNDCADFLAQVGFLTTAKLTIWTSQPPGLNLLVFRDKFGGPLV